MSGLRAWKRARAWPWRLRGVPTPVRWPHEQAEIQATGSAASGRGAPAPRGSASQSRTPLKLRERRTRIPAVPQDFLLEVTAHVLPREPVGTEQQRRGSENQGHARVHQHHPVWLTRCGSIGATPAFGGWRRFWLASQTGPSTPRRMSREIRAWTMRRRGICIGCPVTGSRPTRGSLVSTRSLAIPGTEVSPCSASSRAQTR